ncbi:MAG: hypothetical protein GY774_30300 [Planctomycetes bacterium]|nr:hypothetical protein [Planctomycetota bacterium]
MIIENSIIWIILITAAFIVVIFALWKGRGLKIRKDKNGFSVETDAENKQKPSEQNIIVGEGIEIETLTVGDIAGIKSEDVDSASEVKQNIEVARDAKIKDSDVGDIVGIKQEHKSHKDKK